MKTVQILLVGASLFLAECKSKKGIESADTIQKQHMEQTNSETPEVDQVMIVPEYSAIKTDAYDIIETNIKGDILSLLVQYGGGCEEHEWVLKTNGAYAKSLPPKITLNLEHNSNKDMCRALLRDTLEFDISNIQYSGSSSLKIKFYGFEDKDIQYQY